jgi:hypothetical protein
MMMMIMVVVVHINRTYSGRLTAETVETNPHLCNILHTFRCQVMKIRGNIQEFQRRTEELKAHLPDLMQAPANDIRIICELYGVLFHQCRKLHI